MSRQTVELKGVFNKQAPEEHPRKLPKLPTYMEFLIETAVKKVLRTEKVEPMSSNELIDLIINQYPFDAEGLRDYTYAKLRNNPNITNKELAILLLEMVARNEKFKNMAKIAQTMINEKWWENNV
ncbi:hypothetical protein [Neobacillus mesonae]|uniref:hypothetical protein n=1 Tax=Neobacillus mesonae TaxID=1193713 RepID=UPI00257313ED|nr:hypothetical protein [Neobacillus mesonae]